MLGAGFGGDINIVVIVTSGDVGMVGKQADGDGVEGFFFADVDGDGGTVDESVVVMVISVGLGEDGDGGDLLCEDFGVVGNAFLCEVRDGFDSRFDDGGFWFHGDDGVFVFEIWWGGCFVEGSDGEDSLQDVRHVWCD